MILFRRSDSTNNVYPSRFTSPTSRLIASSFALSTTLGLSGAAIAAPATTAPAAKQDSVAATNHDNDPSARVDPPGRDECGQLRHFAVGETRARICDDGHVRVQRRQADGRWSTESLAAVEGRPLELIELDGQIWVVVRRVSAHPVEPSLGIAGTEHSKLADPVQALPKPAEPTDAGSSTQAVSSKIHAGQVVTVKARTVVIDMGTDHGLALDDRIELIAAEDVDLGEASGPSQRETTVLVGRVISLSKTRAEVSMGVGEAGTLGTKAIATDKRVTRSLVAPPHPAARLNVQAGVRPLLTVGELGGGLIADAEFELRFRGPWSLRLRAEPLAFTDAAGRPPSATVAANLLFGFDHRFFALALGAGYAQFSQQEWEYDEELDEGIETQTTRHSVAFPQYLRLGAVDGLNLVFHSQMVIRNVPPWNRDNGGDEREFAIGSMHGSIQVPVWDRLWLSMRGGGGQGGYGFGDLGLRILAKGNGGHGSLFVTPSLGFGGAGGAVGPLVGIAVESRMVGLKK